MMRFSWRDVVATVLVGIGAALYVAWLAGVDAFGPRVLAGVVLVLGLAASVTAVVYGVGEGLLQASKVYLAVASLFGLAALVAGVMALIEVNEAMLAVLVVATVALWLMSSIRHGMSSAGPAGEVRTLHQPSDRAA